VDRIRPSGTAVFIGGVQSAIPMPYGLMMINPLTIRGAFMYPGHAPGDVMKMISSGILGLDAASPPVFSIQDITETAGP
jgi:threonine dehydrogenase-like Zn-dependent dehydrogenase